MLKINLNHSLKLWFFQFKSIIYVIFIQKGYINMNILDKLDYNKGIVLDTFNVTNSIKRVTGPKKK